MFDYQLYAAKCEKSFTEWEEYRLSFMKPKEESKEEPKVEVAKTVDEEELKKDLRRRLKELGVNPYPKATLEQLQAKLLELNS